ncbi:MAG: hypothetical protein VX764_00170 [Planctomycetota bacterium]|nr:hypothetical protein [Planctomycetota bacterium]
MTPVYAQQLAASDLPIVDQDDRQRISIIHRAYLQSRWEDAFLELLLLTGPQRELARPEQLLDSSQSFSHHLRDRCWRHLRDRLAVLDRYGGSVAMEVIYSRLQRIPVVCIAAGIEPPGKVRQVLDRWRRKIDRRTDCDAVFQEAEQLLMAGDEVAALSMLEPLTRRYPGDRVLAQDVSSLKKRIVARIRSELRGARDRDEPSSVLQLLQQLREICPDDLLAMEMGQWARDCLAHNAAELLDARQSSTALLQLARLLEEGEPVAEKLGKLREQITRPLRPLIIRGNLPIPSPGNDVTLLIAGNPTLSISREEEFRFPSVHFGEVGRRWTRSPAHIADVKRWELLIDDIQRLAALWLQAPPQKAILISARLSFHGSEAWRISRRLSESAGQRSRGVWQEWVPGYSGERCRVSGTLPVWLIDDRGREIGQSIELSLELSPSDPGRGGLPITQAEIDQARHRILGSFDRELEQLASHIARARFDATLQEARELAHSGDLIAAQEVLVPALLGSLEHDQDLQRQATVELARWSQLGVEAVKVAIGTSRSP